MIWGLFIASVGSTVLGLLLVPWLVKLTTIKTSYMIPIIIVLCAGGSYVIRGSFYDIALVLIAGLFGYALDSFKFPLVSFVMGYILGNMAETSFLQSLMISNENFSIFWTRPICIVLIACMVALGAYPLLTSKRKEAKA